MHIEFLRTTLVSDELIKRPLGKYYTPLKLAGQLSKVVADVIPHKNNLSIADPFCGDGRLLAALSNELISRGVQRIRLEGWDIDTSAIDKCLKELVPTFAPGVTSCFYVKDSFLEEPSEKFDVIITNPPWEILKPDKKLDSELSLSQREQYKAHLKRYDKKLAINLPNSHPTRKFAGWGTNLSKCGLELAVKLLRQNGVLGILLPKSVMMDHVSSNFREWLFNSVAVASLESYPAEAKIFEQVDQDLLLGVFKKQKPKRSYFSFVKYDSRLEPKISTPILFCPESLNKTHYTLPLIEGNNYVTQKFQNLKRLHDFEAPGKLWLGRELDETGYSNFVMDKGKHHFLKARMITRYSFQPEALYVNEAKRKLPPTAVLERIAWRDIARRTQERRVKACIIPVNCVTGNSLHVAHTYGSSDRLKALLVVLNSFVFEYQVRASNTTGHISLNCVRNVKIPNLFESSACELLSVCYDEFKSGREAFTEELLEIVVAKLYGLEKFEFEKLLESFDKVPTAYKLDLLSNKAWQINTTILCKKSLITTLLHSAN